ncbi:MAG: hypothetical protein ACOX6Q_00350 [Candidatus Dojkabacteria bacterium]|jgi:hypothetical protein
MKRGILILSKEELLELIKYYDINKDPNNLLSQKLLIATQNIQENNRISVSSEELETILDEIGYVGDDRPVLKQAMNKISTTLTSFNDIEY